MMINLLKKFEKLFNACEIPFSLSQYYYGLALIVKAPRYGVDIYDKETKITGGWTNCEIIFRFNINGEFIRIEIR